MCVRAGRGRLERVASLKELLEGMIPVENDRMRKLENMIRHWAAVVGPGNAADPGSYQNSQEQGHRGASLTDKRQIPASYRHIPRIYFTVVSTAGARLKNLGNGTAIQNQNIPNTQYAFVCCL